MRNFAIGFFLLICSILFAGQLGVYVDSNRFFGPDNKTQVEINYSFPYNAVDFIKQQYGYEAEIFVDISIRAGEKLIENYSFTNKVIIREATKVFSDEQYLDKIILTLGNYDLQLSVEFIDVHTESSYLWEYDFVPLDIDGLLSDLELSSFVKKDTTGYLEKFHRGDYLYQIKPNHTFRAENGYLTYFQQIRNLFEDENGRYQLEQEILVKSGDSLIDSIYNELSGKIADIVTIEDSLMIQDYEDGYYSLIITYRDKITYKREQIEDYFCVKSRKSANIRLFPELEDDIKLVSYFMNSSEKNVFKTLNNEGKSNYLNKFWYSQDPNPATEENEFLELVKTRIHYANQLYSHFKQGWTSDMGRIFIKYGKPYEIRKLTTNLGENEFSESSDYSYDERAMAYYYNKYTVKNYEIWKYRLDKNANYVFIDQLTSGNYKLIYSSDDNDGENTLTDWKKYLGYDFDERLLD